MKKSLTLLFMLIITVALLVACGPKREETVPKHG